jgi:integrase
MAITKREIDAAEYDRSGPGQQILYDGDLPGFGIRLYPSGKKAFVLRYRNAGGQLRFLTIGQYGVLTLVQARDLARRALMEAKTGSDPAEERQEARSALSFAEFAKIYIERYARPHKRTWDEDQQRLEKWHLPAFGSKKLADIKRLDVQALHLKIGEKYPYGANRNLALLSKIFSLAIEWGYLPEGASNPARKGIRKFKERSRDRWVKPDELPRLMKAIEGEPSVYIRGALLLYLLTGARKTEILSARWENVDLERAELRLPDTKAGRSHVIPLSRPAVAIFRELPHESNNPHVFPGRRSGQPLNNISKAWSRIRKESDLEDIRLHDLRRTVGSWLATSGASLPLIGKILNHSNVSTTSVYARLSEDVARTALEGHGEKIMGNGKTNRDAVGKRIQELEAELARLRAGALEP